MFLSVGGSALLVKAKGKKLDRLPGEMIQALKGIPKVSVILEGMSLHQEMNLEKQTDGKFEENEMRGEQ